jgi:shikimate dehydrogenase
MIEFALIGTHINHSLSPAIWKEIFASRKLPDYSYRLLTILETADILASIQENPSLIGFNVTMPFKESILPLLNKMDPVVIATQSCNTVKIHRGTRSFSLEGINTDVGGFLDSFSDFSIPDNARALILGTGGAARSVAYALQTRKVETRMVSRTKKSNSLCFTDLRSSDISESFLIVNATPMGGPGYVDQLPPIPYSAIQSTHILYDLLYHTPLTPFLQKGAHKGAATINGMEMLRRQAFHAAEFLLPSLH